MTTLLLLRGLFFKILLTIPTAKRWRWILVREKIAKLICIVNGFFLTFLDLRNSRKRRNYDFDKRARDGAVSAVHTRLTSGVLLENGGMVTCCLLRDIKL